MSISSSLRRTFFAVTFSIVVNSRLYGADSFTLSAKELLEKANAASATDKSADVVLLLEDERRIFDDDAKLHTIYHAIFVVQNQQGVDNWSTFQQTWEPWHQKRPIIQVRVVTPDAVVHELNPATITDGPAKEDSAGTFSDSRITKCPFPAVTPGAVVEEQVTVDDTQPAFKPGYLGRIYLGRINTRVLETSVVLDYPNSLPLQYDAQNLAGLKMEKTASAARTHIELRLASMDPIPAEPSLLPSSVAYWPAITLSTGESWPAIARAYNAIVETKLTGNTVTQVANQAAVGKTTRDARIESIFRAMQKQVRYTGVEFGDAAIIPATPDETWQRKYGDCKDKATLLVAMLRANGIAAHVALLATGPGQDVDEHHAGFGLFDHAIVYVPADNSGNRAFWIDATDQFGQVGFLPSPDQGRLALVVSYDCRGLTKTVELPAAANTYTETREFFLPAIGSARIVETTQANGNADSYNRGEFGFADTVAEKKNLNAYMHDVYLAQSDVKISHSSGDDFSAPFQLRLEVQAGKRGSVDETGAFVSIDLSGLTNRLAQDLRKTPDPNDKDERKFDYELDQTFRTDWHYRIHLPAGYQAKGLPESVERDFGPAHFTSHYKVNAEVAEVDYSFTMDKRTISAGDGLVLRKTISEFRNQPVITLTFVPLGRMLLQNGKVPEGLASFAAACKKDPSSALAHAQYAMALIEEGMGESARAEALTATKLDPKLLSAWRTQGYVLLNDLIGRQFEPGFDSSGAEQALRKALAIDPKDTLVQRNLAVLLEYSLKGQRYVPGPRLEAAIKVYRGMGDDLRTEGLITNLLYALAYAGHFDEVLTETEKLVPSKVATGLRIVALSQLKNTAAAIAESKSSFSDEAQRSGALELASTVLTAMQKYIASADLLEAAASGSNTGNQMESRAAAMRRIKPIDLTQIKPDTAEHAVLLALLSLFSSEVDAAQFKSYFSADTGRYLTPAQMTLLNDHSRQTAKKTISRLGMTEKSFIDLVGSLIEFKSDPNSDDGARVHTFSPGAKPQVTYVTHESNVYRVLDLEDNPGPVAYHAFRIADSNPDAARQILDWLREQIKPVGGDDALASKPFSRLWTKGMKATSAQIKVAAASLAISPNTASEMRQILKDALTAPPPGPQDGALVVAYVEACLQSGQDLTSAEQRVEDLTSKFPASPTAAMLSMRLLAKQQKLAQAETVGVNFIKAQGDDPDVDHFLVFVYQGENKLKEASDLAMKMSTGDKANPSTFNLLGWTAVLGHSVTDSLIETVQHSATSNANDAALLHTLAMMYAESGKGREARTTAAQAMEGWSITEPNEEIWLVYGRIAETYGLPDDARSAYRKLSPPPEDMLLPASSSYAIAQERLKVLH